jgi:putative two-component system response regulator
MPTKAKVLCVDDTPVNLKLMVDLLRHSYEVKVANNGERALTLINDFVPDIILLDVMMPDMDDYEFCQRVRNIPQFVNTPIIFITAKNSPEDETEAFSKGGNDFISKPIIPNTLKARIDTHIKLARATQALAKQKDALEQDVAKRIQEINLLHESTFFVMISLAEFRDEGTGNHVRRTQKYVHMLAKALAKLPKFEAHLQPMTIEKISRAAPLHDIGKIAIPDPILLKPGKLTDAEFELMKTHTSVGYRILDEASKRMGEHAEFLKTAKEITLSHHEKWDGTGYPQGLKGEAIPLPARIMAVADIYDALTSERPYKRAMSSQEALDLMRENMRGNHIQAEIFDCFEALRDEVEAIAKALPDDPLDNEVRI